MEGLAAVAVRTCIAILVATSVLAQTDSADVQSFLRVIERHETGGDCTARPPEPHSARGCYQMTRIALEDIGLKDSDGNWLPNPFGVASDEEFEQHRPANDYAVKQLVAKNWSYLACGTRYAECAVSGLPLDPPALLIAAHFLGAPSLNGFVECGLTAECLPDVAVTENGGNRTRLHEQLINRMAEVAGLDISPLIGPINGCNRSMYCGD